jgi:hypothetical protein
MPTTIPAVTSSTRPGSPSAGDAYFETDTKNYIIYDGAGFWRIYNNDGSSSPTFPNVYSAELIDGTDDRVMYDSTSGNQTSLGLFNGDMSFVLWYKQNASPSTYEVLISSYHPLTAGDGVQGKFDMDIQSGNRLRIFSRDSSGGGFSDTSGGTVVNNVWNFIAHVVDTSASAHYTYIGSPSSAPTLANTISNAQTLEDFSNGFKLGDGNQLNMSGYVDDFAIFNGKALSSTEVSTIWNNGASFNYAGDASLNPVGWYRMGDDNSGQGTAVQNKVNTGSSYDATLENGAAFSSAVY